MNNLRLCLGLLVVVALSACGGSSKPAGGVDQGACLACAKSMCPTQAAACDASPGCVTLRACSLACKAGDSACQNDCTTKAASDATALVAGANYLACATSMCQSTCVPMMASGGSGGSSGTGGTGGDPNPPNFTVYDGGYVAVKTWHGYAFTGKAGATTIAPADLSTVTAGQTLCAAGTVAGTADYSAVALLGFSLNQTRGPPGGTPGTWSPAGFTGLGGDISNLGTSELRIQVQAPGGDTNANLRWCFAGTSGVGSVLWSDLNTKCWDNTGTPYDGVTPLQSAMVIVPGGLTPVDFNFCLNYLEPQ